MKPTLAALRRARRLTSGAIERYLAAHDFPLAEPGRVTFVHRGEADEVHLRAWVYGLPSSLPFERIGASDLWALELPLPEGSRIEYKLEVRAAGESRWITDPLNPVLAPDPFGANSVCHAHGYVRPEWTLPDPDALPGSIEEMTLGPGDDRSGVPVRVYLPPRFRRTRRYPLLVLHDGGDFAQYGDLRVVLDNLVHRLEIPGLVVALHDPTERTAEYVVSEEHASHLARTLLPALERRLPLTPSPEARALAGASLGAVAALHAAWRHPGTWGRLGLLSGSFAFTDLHHHGRGALFDPVADFVGRLRRKPGALPDRIYLSCGVYESLIHENRALASLLQAHGLEVRYREVRDGHNWENWRDRLHECLAWLLPGPIWLVYE